MPSAVHRERVARRVARPPAPSAARDEGLDALRVAQERDHHGDAAKEETATTDDTGRFKVSNLQPGNYTAIVQGVNNTAGVALVEVYDLN